MMENIYDPYDMLVNAHARIDYLEMQLKNQLIQSQRDHDHIQALHNAISAVQDSQILLMKDTQYTRK